jgi:acyl-CoA thioesterase
MHGTTDEYPGAAALIASAAQADGTLSCAVPDGWLQGRTAFGGFSTTMAYSAARNVAPDLPPLRSAQIAFIGPVAGELQASATLLRRGKSSAYVEARIISGGELALIGTFLFLADRASPFTIAAPKAPVVPAPEEAEPAMRGGKGPSFTGRLEYRHAAAKGAERRPELQRWVRLRDREGLDPVTELLLIGDALPPGISPVIDGKFMASSANWTLHLHMSDIATHDGWWLLRTEAESATGGVSSQQMAVWNRAGDAVLTSSQTVSFFVAEG